MIATLCLFMFLTVMITAVIRGNATRRGRLKTRQDRINALYLAESGVQEALHALVPDRTEGSLERTVGPGRVEVRWWKADGKAGAYEISSVGTARVGVPGCARKTIRARVMARFGTGQGSPSAVKIIELRSSE